MNVRGYLRRRGNKLEAVLRIGDRKLTRSTGYSLGQESQAQQFLEEALREIRSAPSASASGPGVLTFQAWGEKWLAERKVMGKSTASDESARLRHHAFPSLGAIPLARLDKETMLAWARRLKGRTSVDGEPISPRYARHIASTVKACLAEAVERDQIASNPCTWKMKRDLPQVADTNLRKRSEGGFQAHELWLLLNDARIPEHRRVQWGLESLTGMRPGEAAVRKISDLDRTAAPLWRLFIPTAWNSRGHKEGTTKTLVEKVAPIHPALRPLLEHWLENGWREFVGRRPRPGDLLVPAEQGGPKNSSHSNRLFKTDLKTLGLRGGRTHYELRATFRSLALAGGADEHMVDLITHPNPKEAKDLYLRLNVLWPALCRAVEAIILRPPDALEVAKGVAVAVAKKKTPEVSGYLGPEIDGRAQESKAQSAEQIQDVARVFATKLHHDSRGISATGSDDLRFKTATRDLVLEKAAELLESAARSARSSSLAGRDYEARALALGFTFLPGSKGGEA